MSTFTKYQAKTIDVSANTLNEIEKIVGITRVIETNVDGETKTIENWIVLSSSDPESGLYILSKTDSAVEEMTRSIRGLVVDVKNQVLVADSFGYNPIIQKNNLPAKYPFSLSSVDGQEYILDENTQLYPGLPGVVIRVFRHGGKTYTASYKSMDVMGSGSKYAGIEFSEAINSLGGLDTEALFPPEAGEYSPYVYYFIIVHPQLFGTSKMPLHMAHIVYLRHTKMWDPENVKFPRSEIDEKLREPKNLMKFPDLVADVHRDPFTRAADEYVKIKAMKPRQANRLLKTGYYVPTGQSREDYYLPGSYIMAYRFNTDGSYADILRIESFSYAWRAAILGAEQNFRLRFYQLLDLVRGNVRYNFNSDGYRRDMPWPKRRIDGEKIYNFPKYDSESLHDLIKENKLVEWPYQRNVPYANPANIEDQELTVWYNLLYVSPQVHQEEVFNLYEEFILDINSLRWLYLNPKLWEPFGDTSEPTKKGERELYFFLKALDEISTPNKAQALRYELVPKTTGYLLYRFTKISFDLFLKHLSVNTEKIITEYDNAPTEITDKIKDRLPVIHHFMTTTEVNSVEVEDMLSELDFEDYLQLEEYLLVEE